MKHFSLIAVVFTVLGLSGGLQAVSAQSGADSTVRTAEPVPSLMEAAPATAAPQATVPVTATPRAEVMKPTPKPSPKDCDDRDEDCDGIVDYRDPDDDGDQAVEPDEIDVADDGGTEASFDAFIKIPPIDGEVGEGIGDPDFDLLRISADGEVSLTVPDDARDRLQKAIAAGDVSVRGWDPEKKEVNIGPAQVNTSVQLAHFIVALSLADERIEGLETDEGSATVRYRSGGKLLWLFPVKFDLSATTEPPVQGDKGTRIKVRFPWYSFLVRTAVSAGDIESEAAKELLAHELAHVVQQKAQVVSTLSNVLKKHHDSAMAAIQNTR